MGNIDSVAFLYQGVLDGFNQWFVGAKEQEMHWPSHSRPCLPTSLVARSLGGILSIPLPTMLALHCRPLGGHTTANYHNLIRNQRALVSPNEGILPPIWRTRVRRISSRLSLNNPLPHYLFSFLASGGGGGWSIRIIV
jgi:hypothetical protein